MIRKNTKKVPQIVVVTLLSALPVCFAQSALATSSFGLPEQRQSHSQQSVRPIQPLNQTKSYLNSRLRTFLTPSVEDLNTLKSTLAFYKTQLDTLIEKQPENDSPELQTAINTLKTGISTLKTDVNALEDTLNAYNKAKATLTNALKTQTLLKRDADEKKKVYSSSITSHEATKQQLEVQKAALALAQAQLAQATDKVAQAQQLLTNLTAALTQQQEAAAQALQTSNERQINAITSASALEQAQQTLSNAQAQSAQAERDLLSKALRQAQAQENLDLAAAKLQTKQLEVDAATSTYNQTLTNYIYLLNVYTNVYNDYLAAQTTQQVAQTSLIQTQNALAQAQQDYDTFLIPDPTWTPLTYQQERTRIIPTTTLVPRTITTLTGGLTADVFNRQGYNNAPPLPTTTERPFYTTTVPDINFQWGGGNVLGSGRSEDVIVRFTGNISFPTSGNYQFYSPADDGTILLIDGVQVTNDWRDKGGGGSTSAPIYFEGGSSHTITLYYYENGGGAAVWLYYYTPQTGYQIVPAAYLGTIATTETTYVEETTYTYETYYTTEVVPGQVHPLINDPALLPALQEAQANQQAALATFNEADSNWKTAQANQQTAAQNSLASYYQVIDTATSLNALSSDLDVEQNAFNQSQVTSNEANADLQQSQRVLTESQQSLELAQLTSNEATQALIRSNSQLQAAQAAYIIEAQKSQEAQTSNEQAKASLEEASSTQAQAQTALETQTSLLSFATSNEAQANSDKDLAAANSTQADATSNEASTTAQEAQATSDKSATAFQSSLEVAQATKNTIPDLIKEASEIFSTPQGSAEVPTNLDASNLQEIDLSQIDPTELSPEQATLLVAAALETFETAVEGSPEYEQALDALYLAAEQDDIELPQELAAIPGLAGAVEVLNFLGNAGADMSPKVREESEKVVVATVVAAGAAIQSAAAAAATASAPSGGSRRIGK